MISRRQFLKTTAAAGALAGAGVLVKPRRAYAFYQSPGLTKFSQQLRGRDVVSLATEIGVADSDGVSSLGATHYTINIKQFPDTLYPTGFGPTTLWGFVPQKYLVAGPANGAHLGGIIVADKGMPVQITFKNQLPTAAQFPSGQIHIIPVDLTIPGANQAQNRVAIHLHGGHVPWISDGGPFDW